MFKAPFNKNCNHHQAYDFQATLVKRRETKTRPVEVLKWAEECDEVQKL